MIAPLPHDEAARLEALRGSGLLDSPAEQAFDDLTQLAAHICGAPIALVSLIDEHRQWFKSRVGLDARETPRDVAFCAHAILQSELFEVPDATHDARFRENPLVVGDPNIRFYAGYPLATKGGQHLGTLCVIDRRPRNLSPEQRTALAVLGRQVGVLVSLREQMEVASRELLRRRVVEAALSASEQRFRGFMNNSPAVAYMKDRAGRFVFVNERAEQTFGIPAADWLGKTDADLWGPVVAGPLREIDQEVLESGRMLKVVERVPTADGRQTLWQSYKFPFVDGNGQRFLAGMSVDVTAEKEAEDALRASEEKFRSVIERLAEGVYLIDNRTGRIVQANAALSAMLGYAAEQFPGLTAADLYTGEDEGAVRDTAASAQAALERDGRHDLGRRLYRRKDGGVVDVHVQVGFVPHGAAGLTSVIVRDITEQRRYEEQLERSRRELESANAALHALATTDALTGIGNRAAFNRRLEEEVERSRRYGRPLSLLLLDVDHFKAFNDTFGHPAGDETLRAVAAVLARATRANDELVRYGGEEFAVILPDTDRAGALVLAERCRQVVAEGAWAKRAVTVSVGASTVTATTESPAHLIASADVALYRAKEAGRNRIRHAEGETVAAAIR